jgi:hypothetical protein
MLVKNMEIEQIFNVSEMFLWLIIGAILFANGFRRNNKYRKLAYFLSVVFVLFGLSDGVEVHTGAWWRPWWLLVWKGLCILIFATSLIYYIGTKHQKSKEN